MTTPGMEAAAEIGRKLVQRAIQYATPDAAAIAEAVKDGIAAPPPPAEGVERQVVLVDNDGRIRYRSARCAITTNDDGALTLRDLSSEGGWTYGWGNA